MAGGRRRVTPGYVLVLAASLLIAVGAGWTALAARMDRDAYDWMLRNQTARERQPQSMVLAIDEQTLRDTGGMRNVRRTLAELLELLIPAGPIAIPIDILLSDTGDAAENAPLAAVLRRAPNVVLAADLLPDNKGWEEPLPSFREAAKAVGHVRAAPDPVSRVLPLELAAGRIRRWALSLEAARLRAGIAQVIESQEDLEIGSLRIPASRDTGRALYIRYREGIPVLSAAQLKANPSLGTAAHGKVVFVGITAQNAARDRLITPLDDRAMSGVEIHAQAFETIVAGEFLRTAPLSLVVLLCAFYTAAAGTIFALLSGSPAYALGAAVILTAHTIPHLAFSRGLLIPYLAPVWAAWLSAVTAASWQHFVVRRQLRQAEADRSRYQQAIQFVTHEMRSPLTAIQGSSELMGRYNLNDEKRKQMADMINSESKRLAKMIQTFLDIERLSDGRTEIRNDAFSLADVLPACMERARPLAERKLIELKKAEVPSALLRGDRELMEYAIYNLLTNAIKYSPSETTVTVSGQLDSGAVRVSVSDEGIGMDPAELKNIFRKFYRTKKAETSGEAGTGIGLSLVEQIVAHHHGRMEVTSTPGAGSCFTMVLPAQAHSSRAS